MSTNDSDSTSRDTNTPLSDAHGHAALLLVESLIHGLCEQASLNTRRAIEIVERAAEVQREHAEEADGAGAPLWRSHALLMSIAASLHIDDEDPPPLHLVP